MSEENRDINFQFGRWVSSPPAGEEVVITGMSGRFPNSRNVRELHENLINKIEMVSDDDRRWTVHHPQIPKRGAKIYDIEKFDAGHFGIHYRQAHHMDPLLRTIMEPTIEAIMDAGFNPSELAGTKTGVFMSACYSESEIAEVTNITEPHSFAITGYPRSLIPQRISYYLKLKGPSHLLDTACSSSLNALDHALKAIRSGQCDNALVGGTNMTLHPAGTLQFFLLGIISAEGRCKVFDQEANGYVRGEGSACLFLQKAKNSRRCYARIINIKSNCDGFKEQGITFPSFQGQTQLLTELYEESDVDPNDLSYLEAHCTGTAVGDPEEIEAIDSALAKKRQQRLLVGSVKCSIGHTEPISGVNSIIKVLLAMESGVITPNINIKQIRKGMTGVEEGRIEIVRELTRLEKDDAIAGVSNFGFGGSNVHTILQRFQKKKINGGLPDDDLPRLICVSGRSQQSVHNLLSEINNQNLDSEYVGLLHQVFKIKIQEHLFRGYTIMSKDGPIKTSGQFYPGQPSSLYVIFGPFINNFKILATYLWQFPAFQSSISRIDNLLPQTQSFEKILKGDTETYEDIVGSVCVQIALVDMLKRLEISPAAVYGESYSKLIVEYYYDAITLEEAISKIVKLGHLIFNVSLSKDNTMSKDKAKLRSDALNHRTIESKDSFIFNISDDHFNHRDVLPVEGNVVKILEVFGNLFERGHQPQLHKLYPEVEFPVSRSTPMISSSIQWDHSIDWHTYKFAPFQAFGVVQNEFSISNLHEEFKFIKGHVIDGRNLFPATEYLYLVWVSFAEARHLRPIDVPIMFEDCKFMRALTVPTAGYLMLLVTIQNGSHNFEITEKDSVVVSGRIRTDFEQNYEQLDPIPFTLDEEENPEKILEQDEIYRELYLRGYNYSGLFKGIVKCDVEVNSGLITWQNNWSSFMDKMLQMSILKTDTRLLNVPVCIKRITIIPQKHLQLVKELGSKPLVPVHVYRDCNIIKSGGIEICGLQGKSILRKKIPLEPVLEKNEFVPNTCFLDLPDALRVNTQIILENSLENNFKTVEIVDDDGDSKNHSLLPMVFRALEDLPIIIPDLTISSKTYMEPTTPGIKVEDVVLTPESDLLLLIGSRLLQRGTYLEKYYSCLTKDGFVLTREELDFIPEASQNIEIVTEFSTPHEKLVLFRKRQHIFNTKFIEISSGNFDWVPQLQNSLRHDPNVTVISKNEDFGGVLGLVNCIRQEPHGNKLKCFFLMDAAPEFNPDDEFYNKQINSNLAVNIYKDNAWGTYRHLPLEEPREIECQNYFVNSTVPGNISSLTWLEGDVTDETPVPEDSLLVKVCYSAINFKDIMIASGRLEVSLVGNCRLRHDHLSGFEFSGIDIKGRRIAGISKGSALASHVVVGKECSWEIPDSWSLEDAATVSVIYQTVIYGLLTDSDLKPGTSILIHSATGGIGMAALNVSLHYRCNIFVTVGTQEKREYLRKHFPQISESHIGNSRDTSFEEMIKTETRNRGVDIVLNSLTDEKLKASVRCLAQNGRFLEIGKYDMANDTFLNLLLLEKEASYHGIMLDKLMLDTQDFRKRRIAEIFKKGIAEGFVRAIPRTVFGKEEVVAAYRYMMTGQHMGKVLVKIRDEDEPPSSLMAHPRFCCDGRFSYVVVGGLGGIGLELADWLILRGARKFILTSRSGVQTGYQMQRINYWESYGVKIIVSTKSAASRKGCRDLIHEATALGPVDAVFNLAVVLKDALFEDQTEDAFLDSMAPKAEATKYLDQVTREMCANLRYFVVFSSVSCGRGNKGQSNYGMANSIMERICERRKLDGLPALAIQWGAIGEVGLVAKMQKENKELVIGGTLQQKVSSCFEVLDKLLKQQNPVVSSMLVAEKYKRDVLSSPVEAVAHVLGIKDIKTVSPHVTLAELGMDSMMGTEIIQLLEKEFEIYITARDVRSLTFAKLTEMEVERQEHPKDKEIIAKPQLGTNLLVQYIPESTNDEYPLVRLPSRVQENDKAVTAFVFAGIEGVFHPFEILTKQLKMHVIGVRYRYNNPEDTIQEMASYVASHIEKKLCKDTPFFIISYSMGAVVALEATSLLESQGYKGTTILVDGTPASLSSWIKSEFPTATDSELQTAISSRLLEILLPFGEIERFQDKFLQCATLDDRLDLVLAILPSTVDKQKLDKQAGIALYKHIKALLTYKPNNERIKSQVYLFKAKYSLFSDEGDQALSKMCERTVRVTVLDGDHVTILNNLELAKGINGVASNKL